MAFSTDEAMEDYQAYMRVRAERMPAVLVSSNALHGAVGIAHGTRYTAMENKVVLWMMPKKAARPSSQGNADQGNADQKEVTTEAAVPSIKVEAPADKKAPVIQEALPTTKSLRKRRSSNSLEKRAAPRRRLQIDTSLANASRFEISKSSELPKIEHRQALPPVQQAVHSWISGHDAQKAQEFSLLAQTQMSAAAKSVAVQGHPPHTPAPPQTPTFDSERTTLFRPLSITTSIGITPPPDFIDQYDIYYHHDRPINWDAALSSRINEWLQDSSTTAISTDLLYIHFDSTDSSIFPVDLDVLPELKLRVIRMTISAEAEIEIRRPAAVWRKDEAPLLDWLIIECSHQDSADIVDDYWMLAFPACAVTDGYYGPPSKGLAGGCHFAGWTLGRLHRVPLLHGRNVPPELLKAFFIACASGKGVIELGSRGQLFGNA